MRLKYPQADGRAIVPRKWSTDKFGGPLIYFAERVLKRLIQHGYAASYVARATNRLFPVVVDFDNALGQTVGFLTCLSDCVYVVAAALRIDATLQRASVSLVGDWRLVVKGGYVSFRLAGECPF